MTEEVIRLANEDTTALAGEQDTAQVVWCEARSELEPGVFLRLLDESAWQPPKFQSDPEVQPALDPCQPAVFSSHQGMEFSLIKWGLILIILVYVSAAFH